MSSISTFGSFTMARLGIYTSQQGLNVTGNNISNINTKGYTRQALDQMSLNTSGSDRYANMSLKIGNGAIAYNVSQLRDPYLDIRYRSENAEVGAADTWLAGLNELAVIIDEVGDGNEENGVIAAQLTDLVDMLENLSESTGRKESDTLVSTSAESLVKLFNSYSNQLTELFDNTVAGLEQDVKDVNEILKNIRGLNEEIRKAEIHNDNALELRDERNTLIDELSYYLDIDVTYSEEDIGAGLMVEKLTISLSNANPDPNVETDSSILVDGVYAAQLSINTKENPDGTTSYVDNYDMTISKLLDKHDKEWINYGKTTTSSIPNTSAYVKLITEAVDGTATAEWADAAGNTYALTAAANAGGELSYTLRKTAAEPNPVTNANGSYVDASGNELTLSVPATDANGAPTTDANGNPVYTTVTLTPDTNADSVAGAFPITDANGAVLYNDLNEYLAANAATSVDLFSGISAGGVDSYFSSGAADLPPAVTITSNDGSKVTQYGVTTNQDGSVTLSTKVTEYTVEIALDDNDLYGSIQSTREMLTETGEFASQSYIDSVDENAATKRGILYYQKALDALANKIATVFNEANTGYMTDENGNYYNADGSGLLTINGQNVNRYGDSDAMEALAASAYKTDANGNYVDANGDPLTVEVTTTNADGSTTTTTSTLNSSGITAEQEAAIRQIVQYTETDNAGSVTSYNYSSVDDYLKDHAATYSGLDEYLADNGMAAANSGVLFSNSGDSNDTEKITAANISVAKDWASGAVQMVSSYVIPTGFDKVASTDNSNILHFIALTDESFDYRPSDTVEGASSVSMFQGDFYEMLTNIGSVLGKDQHSTETVLNTHYDTALEIDTGRDSISAVDLNDEAMNLVMYQNAYSAACRFLTTLDQTLDKLINGTGTVGL